MTKEDKLCHIIRTYVVEATVGDVEENLCEFFSEDYHIEVLNKNGIIGYAEYDNFYFLWFAYNDGLFSNTKLVYNTAKRLSKIKPVLYSGVKNLFFNNSIELKDGLYKINIGE